MVSQFLAGYWNLFCLINQRSNQESSHCISSMCTDSDQVISKKLWLCIRFYIRLEESTASGQEREKLPNLCNKWLDDLPINLHRSFYSLGFINMLGFAICCLQSSSYRKYIDINIILYLNNDAEHFRASAPSYGDVNQWHIALVKHVVTCIPDEHHSPAPFIKFCICHEL